jgi:hypothetical protein
MQVGKFPISRFSFFICHRPRNHGPMANDKSKMANGKWLSLLNENGRR